MASGRTGNLGTIDPSGSIPIQTARTFDRSSLILWKLRADAPFMFVMSKKSKKSLTTSGQFYEWEYDEVIQEGQIGGINGTTGADAAITTSTSHFKITSPATDVENFLQPGDKIHIPPHQDTQTNADVRHTGETIIVERVYKIGSTQLFEALRNSGSGTDAGNVTADSATTIFWRSTMNARPEGQGPGIKQVDALAEDYQYLQIGRVDYGFTGSFRGENWYYNEANRVTRSKAEKFARDYEGAMLWNDQWKRNVQGQREQHMGGVMPYLANLWGTSANTAINTWSTTNDLVSGNGTSRIYDLNGANLSVYAMLDFVEKCYYYGGMGSKLGLIGPGLATEMQKMFHGSVTMEPDEKTYGLKVMKWETVHGDISLMIEPMFRGTYPYDLLVLDFRYMQYRYKVSQPSKNPFSGNRDIKTVALPPGKEDVDDYALFGEIAIDPRVKATHSWMTNGSKAT